MTEPYNFPNCSVCNACKTAADQGKSLGFDELMAEMQQANRKQKQARAAKEGSVHDTYGKNRQK